MVTASHYHRLCELWSYWEVRGGRRGGRGEERGVVLLGGEGGVGEGRSGGRGEEGGVVLLGGGVA